VLTACLAYDLKLVIDKGIVDVLKPSWITDSIEGGEKAPMQKKYDLRVFFPFEVSLRECCFGYRYFFHATEARATQEDYDMEVEEDAPTFSSAAAGSSANAREDEGEDLGASSEAREGTPKVEEDDEMDPSLADWFRVDKNSSADAHNAEDDSVTEADSDNDDVVEPQELDVDLDDWFQVKDSEKSSVSAGKKPEAIVSGLTLLMFYKHLCSLSMCRMILM